MTAAITRTRRTIPILMYHSISRVATDRFRPFTMTPERFEGHLAYLADQHYATYTVSELVAALESDTVLPERVALITFDDGFADFHSAALPLLQQYGHRSTLYVVSDGVEGASYWMTNEGETDRPIVSWTQLREIAASGVECGAHSHTHRQLDTLWPSRARAEVVRSKQVLEEGLGQAVTSFAYPYGYHGPAVRRMVLDAGYQSACAVKHVLSHDADDHFALGRIIVTADDGVEQLARWLDGQDLPSAWTGERLGTIGWRMARRGAALFHRRLG
jgi:peptidoglycan/xylan/chitin deacetylase (PgdA/CDA1 family)